MTGVQVAPIAILIGVIASGQCSAFAKHTRVAQSSGNVGVNLQPPAGLSQQAFDGKQAQAGGVPSKSDEMTLSDLRDLGLCIMQIKQQSINIYLEVTRKAIPAKSSAQMDEPSQISSAGFSPQSQYLPTRIEWLTFYVGIMEPIIRLFKEDLKDAETGVQKIVIPKGHKDKFEKIFEKYGTAVKQINVHLTNIYDQISLPDNNVKIATEAVKIFELSKEIEKDRQDAYRLIQQLSGTKEVEILVPKTNE